MKRTKFLSLSEDYVSASSVHNYILNDTLVDWLKMYMYKDLKNDVNNYILEQGIKFEKKVIDTLKSKLNTESFVQVYKGDDYEGFVPKDNILYESTLELMSKKTGIIYQGVLHGNNSFKFYGCPDLIIRTDLLNKLFNTTQGPKESLYSIIDIKFCTLHLTSNGINIQNNGRMTANKAQVMIYNKLLNISGYKSNDCFILGRGFDYTKNGIKIESNSFLDRLGIVDPNGYDSWLNSKIEESYKWLIDLKTNGSTWSIDPPSRKELYPNMCVKYDFVKQKKELAKKISEITMLWNVGIKHRELCHSKGVFRMDDNRLTIELMELPDTERSKTIQKMIDFNQGKIFPNSFVIPNKISKKGEWCNAKKIEFFIDFETFTNIFDSFESESKEETNMVFMIGIYVVISNNEIKNYYNFRINSINKNEELIIFKEMHKKIDEILLEHNYDYKDCRFYHWGNIEKNIYEKLNNTHNCLREMKFIDINRVFQNEPILIKGVYDFSIKSIGKALIDLKLIECDSWTECIANGLQAMVESYKLYNSPDTNKENMDKCFEDIIKYNKIDCEITYQILKYIRNKHL